MSAVIEKNKMWTSFRSDKEYPQNWKENTETEYWVPIPQKFEDIILQNVPYINVKYNGDEIVDVEILPKPEPEPEPYLLTYEDKILLHNLTYGD